MRRTLRLSSTVALALAGCLVVGAPVRAQEAASRPLPFSDDVAPPPPLPEPLDRHFEGELVSFDGVRITLRWDWSDAAQLADFDAFVPVRHGLQGGFTLEDGRLVGRGTGGVRLRLGMLDDIVIHTTADLLVPHDLGIVMTKPDNSDESIVCLLQDKLFTRFDAAAGNTNMINKLGGIPASAPGVVEFRYIARSLPPALERGDKVTLDVVRKAASTRFVITPQGADPVALSGKDTDTPMTYFTPGLYVSGGAASFGPLEITGALDPAWCTAHDVLPFVAGNLLDPGNRFKGRDKKAAADVEDYLSQDETTPEKKLVPAARVAALVGREELPLVIRIRAAEALMERGTAEGTVVDRITELLTAKDRPARVLAWQVLRPQLPWHFHYEPDAPQDVRREAALMIGSYFREQGDALALGKVFHEGYWMTPSRADATAEAWDHAYDWRSAHVRLRTNLTREWAAWYFAALEAGYAEMTRVIGHEPPPAMLPLSVLVFRQKTDFEAFCSANGYEDKAAWGRFTDLDRGVAFVTFDRKSAPHWANGQMARLFLHRATGRYWPAWYDEGRSAWFGNPSYESASWDGTKLTLGKVAEGHEAVLLRAAAHAGEVPGIEAFLAEDPRALEGAARRRWYAEAWALHHWFMREADEDLGERFGRWQSAMESSELTPHEVDAEGRRLFLTIFAGRLPQLDTAFMAWLENL